MHYNFQLLTWPTYNLNTPNLNSQTPFFHFSLLIDENLRSRSRSLRLPLLRSSFGSSFRSFLGSKLFRLIVLPLSFLLIPFYSSYALTSKTLNQIHGNAPYLTFDGGYTRVTNTDGLLGITLSNGTQYTPSTNPSSSSAPIVLPVAGQSFADIGMLVPTDTNSVALSSLIGPPYNYWGDDDGDGDISATGYLNLSIVDKNGQSVSRNAVPKICNAPYQVKLTNTDGILSTRYGLPSHSSFSASNVTYYINPNPSPTVCFARPNLLYGKNKENNWPLDFSGPASIWDPANGFLPQSSYGLNFPTTGAHGLYFDLLISDSNQALSWSPVSKGGITATMSNSTSTGVRVTLTGPVATESQHDSGFPGPIPKPPLPLTFELVGRDSQGNAIVKYGFTLKKWFVNRGTNYEDFYPDIVFWCNSLGYRVSRVSDLTNSNHRLGTIPSSSGNHYQRRIGSGFFTEWGKMDDYSGADFISAYYWTSDQDGNRNFIVFALNGYVNSYQNDANNGGLCTYP